MIEHVMLVGGLQQHNRIVRIILNTLKRMYLEHSSFSGFRCGEAHRRLYKTLEKLKQHQDWVFAVFHKKGDNWHQDLVSGETVDYHAILYHPPTQTHVDVSNNRGDNTCWMHKGDLLAEAFLQDGEKAEDYTVDLMSYEQFSKLLGK